MDPSQTKQIELKHPGGRPSIITPEITARLTVALQIGMTDEIACQLAGIDRATFYRHMKNDPEFCNKMRAAKTFLIAAAGNVILDVLVDKYNKYSIAVKAKMAMWIYERRMPEMYGEVCKFCRRRKIRGEWQKEAPIIKGEY